ncbi:MAG: hypothetical protein R3B93_24320 [Bacteroidia bacterium]
MLWLRFLPVRPVSLTKDLRFTETVMSNMASREWNNLRGELEISTSRFAISGGVSQRNLGNIVPGENQPKLPHTGYKELAGDVKANLKISSRHLLTLSYQQLEQKNVPDYAKITREDYENI